MSNLMMAL